MAQSKKKPIRKSAARKSRDGAKLVALRKPVEEAQAAVAAAEVEAKSLQDKAKALVAEAKAAYRAALAPYREACRNAGVACEFAGGRSPNVAERVRFEVEKVSGGIRVMVRGRPETEEVIPAAKLKVSVGKCALQYTEKHLGPASEVGNKAGSLANQLRAANGR